MTEVRPSYPKVIGWGRAKKKPIVVKFREVVPNFESTVTTQDSSGMNPPQHAHTKVEKIETREGVLFGYPDKDYVIEGVRGEIYPIGKDIFHETYEVIHVVIPDPQSSPTKARKQE